MDHPEFLSLPDCELLAVLCYLSPEELLQCREVCRRLRDTCLHPQLWRSVRLFYDGSTESRVLPILRLAPCLRELDVLDLEQEVMATICRSSCVVKKLSLHISWRTHVARAIVLLQRMCTTGGLQELCIKTDIMGELEPLLFMILYSLNNLTALSLKCITATKSSYSLEGTKPSLTSLHFECNHYDNSFNFLQTLLKGHAPTLRTLHLKFDKDLPLFLLIPNLESLTCSPMDSLSQLQSAAFLTEVNLSVPFLDEYPRGALEFLRGAPQLRHVSVYMPKKNSAAPLLALSESPSAGRVERLSLCGDYLTESAIKQVADSLHHFPSLHSLTVEAAAKTAILRALTMSMPRLTTLKVRRPDGCLHNWLHGPIGELLDRSPRLHLRVMSTHVSEECTCLWCEWGCHTELKRSTEFAFSWHRREVGCPPDCFQIPKFASSDL